MNKLNQINLTTNSGRFKFLISILRKHIGLASVYLVVTILVAISNAVIPYFTKLQIDVLEQRGANYFGFGLNPLVFLGIFLLLPAIIELLRLAVFNRLEFKFFDQLSQKIRESTERLVWEKMKQLDAGFFQSQRNKRLLYDVIDSTYVSQSFFRLITQHTSGVFTLLAIIPLLALVSWQLLALILFTALLQYFVSQKISQLREGYTLLEKRANEKSWHLQDLLRNDFFNLQSMGAIERFIVEYYQSLRKRDELAYQREKNSTLFRGYTWFLDNMLLIGANIFVGYQVINGNLSLGTFTLTVSYTTQINRFFSTLISSSDQWRGIVVSLTKLNFFFLLKSRLKSKLNPRSVSVKPSKIELRQTDFIYPEHFEEEKSYIQYMVEQLRLSIQRHRNGFEEAELIELEKILAEKPNNAQVLNQVSLELTKGKIVALVGRNGSGKTTITHLIQHHYEPNSGEVLLDGKPLFEYQPEQLARLFSWLQQEPFLLERYTIKDNLLLGSQGSADELEKRMMAVLKKLNLSTLIKSLPKGVDSVLGEDTSLSGGQRQLLVIARTMIQNRPFVIFDEGSSQLDVEKEFMVLEQLKELKKTAGILFITHRMSVARKADYIYVLDKGKIVEEGTHADLLDKKGQYFRFWEMQVIT